MVWTMNSIFLFRSLSCLGAEQEEEEKRRETQFAMIAMVASNYRDEGELKSFFDRRPGIRKTIDELKLCKSDSAENLMFYQKKDHIFL